MRLRVSGLDSKSIDIYTYIYIYCVVRLREKKTKHEMETGIMQETYRDFYQRFFPRFLCILIVQASPTRSQNGLEIMQAPTAHCSVDFGEQCCHHSMVVSLNRRGGGGAI